MENDVKELIEKTVAKEVKEAVAKIDVAKSIEKELEKLKVGKTIDNAVADAVAKLVKDQPEELSPESVGKNLEIFEQEELGKLGVNASTGESDRVYQQINLVKNVVKVITGFEFVD